MLCDQSDQRLHVTVHMCTVKTVTIVLLDRRYSRQSDANCRQDGISCGLHLKLDVLQKHVPHRIHLHTLRKKLASCWNLQLPNYEKDNWHCLRQSDIV